MCSKERVDIALCVFLFFSAAEAACFLGLVANFPFFVSVTGKEERRIRPKCGSRSIDFAFCPAAAVGAAIVWHIAGALVKQGVCLQGQMGHALGQNTATDATVDL